VGWCGGSDTMEDILSRIHQREEAAVKRERALAYAFSHQVHKFTRSLLPSITTTLMKYVFSLFNFGKI